MASKESRTKERATWHKYERLVTKEGHWWSDKLN